MTYEKEMISVGEELIEAIHKEIRPGAVVDFMWDMLSTPVNFILRFKTVEDRSHTSEWLLMELPTEFSTYFLLKGNRILFLG